MIASNLRPLVLRFAALYIFWVVLSGRLEAKYLAIGLLCALLVTFFTMDLVRPVIPSTPRLTRGLSVWIEMAGRLVSYFLWLFWSIVQSNLQVAYIVLHPRINVKPGLLCFRTKLRSGTGHVILANSITLTPGTITVDLNNGIYTVHALVPEAAQSLLSANMQRKIERIFGEPEERTSDIRWIDAPEGPRR